MTDTDPTTSSSREGFAALASTLPSGRASPAVPTAARDLVDHARAAGWLTLVRWAEATDGSPFLDVQLGIHKPPHFYKLCWHSFGQCEREFWPYRADVSGVRLRLFSKIVRTTGRWRDAPSLKKIRQVIDQHQQPIPLGRDTNGGGPRRTAI